MRMIAQGHRAQQAIFGIFAAMVTVAAVVVVLEGHARVIIGGVLILGAVVIAPSRPRTVILSLMVFLPFLGEIRRLLLYIAPWSGFDPIQLVSPVIAFVLFSQALRSGRKIPKTPTSKAATFLLGIMTLQIFNPLQGGLLVGVAGVMFYIAPLLWFWTGRVFATHAVMRTILFRIVPIAAALTAMVGLYQVFVGFLPHQQYWIDNHGYAALYISATQVRAFSTFSSGQEFSAYMVTAAAMVSTLYLATRKPGVLAPLPLYIAGAFVQASRGPMLSFVQVFAVAWSVSNRRPATWLPRVLVAGCLLAGCGYTVLVMLNGSGMSPGMQSIVSHQVDGLTDPLNHEKSTAGTHLAMKGSGILRGFQNPIGYGLGSTTMAAEKFGSTGMTSEVDVSNMFISLGFIGGIAYLVLMFRVVLQWIKLQQRFGSAAVMAIGVMLAGNYGHWISGSLYSLAPLFWLSMGYLDRLSVQHDLAGRLPGPTARLGSVEIGHSRMDIDLENSYR